jgi:hypothetical protein
MYSCSPPFGYTSPEIRLQCRQIDEVIGQFSFVNVHVVTLASFVIEPEHTHTVGDQSQAVF